MNAALRKEIRLLLPMWILALVLAIAPVWIVGTGAVAQAVALMKKTRIGYEMHQQTVSEIQRQVALKQGTRIIDERATIASRFSEGSFLAGGFLHNQVQSTENACMVFFVAGALLLSLASFGYEMSFGTFPSLLAQPCPRVEIWQRKIGLLALALASLVAASGLSWWWWMQAMLPRIPQGWPDATDMTSWLWPLHLQSVLLLTIIAFASGLWTTLLFRQMMAAFWFAILTPCLLRYFCVPLLAQMGGIFDSMFSPAIVACGYGFWGFFLARWLFFHAQDKPERETTDVMTWSFLPAFRTKRRPVAALMVKELRLQQGTLVIAVGLVFLHLAAVAAQVYMPPAVAAKYSWFQGIWMVWFIAPLLVACASVAEERRGRTLEGALCLPVAGPWQFAIKLVVVFGLGILLGAFMPWLLELLRPGGGMNDAPIKDIGLLKLLLPAVTLTGIGCYGSSLCNTLLQAFGVTLVLCVVLNCVVLNLGWISGIGWLFWPALIIVSVFLSYANFKQLRITGRQLLRNGNTWLAAIFATMLLWGAIAYWMRPPDYFYK